MWGSYRLSKHSCRGEHCSPVPVCLARNCPGKCVAAVSWRATNGRPYTRNKAKIHFFDSLNPKYFGQPHSSLPHRLRAEPFGPGPLCRWRDISPHRGESPSQRGPRGEHTFFDSLHLTLFLFPLPCSRLIRSTRMHRFLESSACRSSELHQPTVQLEYRMIHEFTPFQCAGR